MMILNCRGQWVIATLLSIPTVDLQMVLPIAPMPPPMFAFPPPLPPSAVPMAFPPSPPVAFQIVHIKTRRTTPASLTGTVAKNVKNRENGKSIQNNMISKDDAIFDKTIGIAIPMAFPGPVQIALPHYRPPIPSIIAATSACMRRPRPPDCPVCPPCSCTPCTPSYFANCSACHKKCRCRHKKNSKKQLQKSRLKHSAHLKRVKNLVSMAKHRHEDSDYSSDYSSDSSDYFDSSSFESTSDENYFKKKKAVYSKNKKYYRKSNFESDMNENNFVKPILSYVSNDGIVKLEKPLSDAEAEELMDEAPTEENDKVTKVYRKVQVIADENEGKVKRVKVVSDVDDGFKLQSENNPYKPQRRHKKVVLDNLLREGKKEIIFMPAKDKRISNVSLSFQVA